MQTKAHFSRVTQLARNPMTCRKTLHTCWKCVIEVDGAVFYSVRHDALDAHVRVLSAISNRHHAALRRVNSDWHSHAWDFALPEWLADEISLEMEYIRQSMEFDTLRPRDRATNLDEKLRKIADDLAAGTAKAKIANAALQRQLLEPGQPIEMDNPPKLISSVADLWRHVIGRWQ